MSYTFMALVIGNSLVTGSTMAQGSLEQGAGNKAQVRRQFAFEVLSLRPHKPGSDRVGVQYLPNGYKATVTLEYAIKLAYIPLPASKWSSSKIENEPDWVANDLYDIDARVAPEDMAAWQQAREDPPGYDSELLHSGWRVALKERCKFAFHMTSTPVPYWDLMVNKRSTKLAATVPGIVKPIIGKTYKLGGGFYIQDDGKRRFVGVSMDDFTIALTRLNRDLPVQDKTALPGRYDFTLPWFDHPNDLVGGGFDQMPVSNIGLMLKRGKGPGFTVTIDHIEKPDPN